MTEHISDSQPSEKHAENQPHFNLADQQETTHFGFKTVAKEDKQNWWRMCFIRWLANTI